MTPAYCRSCDHTHVVGTPCWFAGSGDGRPVGSPPREHWTVSVSRNGENVVTIESNCLSGRDLSAQDEATIRDCAEQLLAFVGSAALSRREPALDALYARVIERFRRCGPHQSNPALSESASHVYSWVMSQLAELQDASRREPSDLAARLRNLPRSLTWRIAEAFQEYRGPDADAEWVKWSDIAALLAGADARQEP